MAKCYYSPKYPVSLLTEKRIYITLKKDSWRWIKYKKIDINYLKNKINLNIPHINASTFTVLRYFKGGSYSRILLEIYKAGNIIVLKEFLNNSQDADQENVCWEEINKVNVVLKQINKNPTLIMPLALHVHVDWRNKNIYIPLDLKIWSVQERAIPDKLPRFLEKINEGLSKPSINIREIVEAAIEKCAKAKWIHKDLEFRHIAVLPVIDGDKLIGLDPIFIDFGIMEKSSSEENAKKLMMKRLDKIYREYSNYSFN